MMKKHALFLVTDEYEDKRLASLPVPGRTHPRLVHALENPGLGGFTQVIILRNPDPGQALQALDHFFSQTPHGDLAVAYFSGHGFIDAQGEVFLALRESDLSQLKSTALTAEVMGMRMDRSPSPHKLLMLDCRFRAPFLMEKHVEARFDAGHAFAGRGLSKTLFCASEEVETAEKIVDYPVDWDFTLALAESLEASPDPSRNSASFTLDDWWRGALERMAAGGRVLPVRYRLGDPGEVVLRSPQAQAELALSSSLGPSVSGAVPGDNWSGLTHVFPPDMQKTMFFTAPDRQALPEPEALGKAPSHPFGGDANATLMVSRDEFLGGQFPAEPMVATDSLATDGSMRWSQSLELPESTWLKKLVWILGGLLPLGILIVMYRGIQAGWIIDPSAWLHPGRESHATPRVDPGPEDESPAPKPSSVKPSAPTQASAPAKPPLPADPAPSAKPAPSAQSHPPAPPPFAHPAPSAQPLKSSLLPPSDQPVDLPQEGDAVVKARVQETLRRSSPDIRALYERFLMGFPELKGQIVVALTVNPNGKLLHASIRNSTTGVPRFDAEILRLAETWELGPFPGKTAKLVTIPLRFPSP